MDWGDLERELDGWAQAGQAATLWWRDDDAVTSTPELQRLLEIAGPLPLSLAVVPAQADATLAGALRATDHVVALQHGFAHANQAVPPNKKAEFGGGRDPAQAARELQAGSRRLRQLLGERALPVLVPPWNRIDLILVGRLAELGIRGLSTYGPRAAAATAGVVVVNTHVDIIDWHGARRFLGLDRCLQLAIGHLAARRQGRVDPNEPTGLLTHHLVHDAEAWSFLAAFSQRTASHAAVRWMGARQLFGCGVERPA